jgi:hypothetical protein
MRESEIGDKACSEGEPRLIANSFPAGKSEKEKKRAFSCQSTKDIYMTLPKPEGE